MLGTSNAIMPDKLLKNSSTKIRNYITSILITQTTQTMKSSQSRAGETSIQDSCSSEMDHLSTKLELSYDGNMA